MGSRRPLCRRYPIHNSKFNRRNEKTDFYYNGVLDGNSDAGTDSQHPAGTSLADMVKIIWSDPYWIVKNGYKSYSGEDAYYGYKGFPHANRVQRLEEFNKSTHLYMGHLFYIVPEEFQFDEGKQYTVILRLSDGKQVEIKSNVFHKPNE